ncbi:hypothetical protein [Staphylococcus sp. 17KM0847]|uniref:hypothetical protein n=1 Tax=Staphylococcus sp. 17KM0847 TaxID=2583989 RepID=UPI0015DC3CE7|nr:hypothetical protein [Staphylococcus sp. 17KM0847]QLK85927.1 hypothetical protein FGL66_04005 [Staphylococcus sp. 17KM0847]
MKRQTIIMSVAASALLLSGCGFLNKNNETPQQSDTQSTNQNTQNTEQKQNANEMQQNDNSQQNNKDHLEYIHPKNTREYYAQIWLSVRNDIENFDKMSMSYNLIDYSGSPINPYNTDASKTFPEGTIELSPNPTAAGHVIFKDNNNGTITVYDAPSHFQDRQWFEDDYSLNETQKILENANTIPIKNASQSDINYVAKYILDSTPQPLNSFSSNGSSNKSNQSSTTKVTRSNVIDLVEDYEGHLLDTDTYTYKEPEQMPDGRWGFSILDKSGHLAGSYIIDTDGTVTKYDEKGQPI